MLSGVANHSYGPNPALPVFVDEVVLVPAPHIYLHVVQATSVLQQQRGAVTTETAQPTNPQLYTLWPLAEKVN